MAKQRSKPTNMVSNPDSYVAPCETGAESFEASLIADLPEEIFTGLIRLAPQRPLWEWLQDTQRAQLMRRATQGFQRIATSLRHPQVRARLAGHLQQHADDFREVLNLWKDSEPTPHSVAEVAAFEHSAAGEQQLIDALPILWRDHGIEALLLALLAGDRRQALLALETLDEPVQNDELSKSANNEAIPEFIAPPVPATEELEKLREEALLWQQKAALTERNAREQGTALQGEIDALRAELDQFRHKSSAGAAQLSETKKLLDRAERRVRGHERDLLETTTNNKRLQKQMRRQQQLNEELRKQLISVNARLEATLEGSSPAIAPSAPIPVKKDANKPAASSLSPHPPAQTSLLDQKFVWKADGRSFQVSPRDIQRAVDRNDEDFVFSLIQALDALRATNERGYKMLLERIRQVDRYYARVLTADTTRVLVDASNVARYEKDKAGRGQLRNLLTMRDELRRRDCFPILIYADASLPHNIDESPALMQLAKAGAITMTPAGQEADDELAREARRTGAYVVTNDRGFHLKVTPNFEPPRIGFRFVSGCLMVEDF